MKEYILNIAFKNLRNELWFMNDDTPIIEEKWKEAVNKIDSFKASSKDAISFQNSVIEYLNNLGFIRIQK